MMPLGRKNNQSVLFVSQALFIKTLVRLGWQCEGSAGEEEEEELSDSQTRAHEVKLKTLGTPR